MVSTKKMFIVRLLFKLLPASRMHNIKSTLLRWAGMTVGKNVEIFSSAKIIGNMTLKIGDSCFIGHEALIMGPKGSTIILEDFCKIGSRTILVTGTHRFSPDGNCIEKEGGYKDITISTGAVVSTSSLILPGVTVGKMAHVAPGAVVSKNVEPYHRVGGVPAKFIKNLNIHVE